MFYLEVGRELVGGGLLNSMQTLSFPWRAAPSVNVRLHVVQHVGQCVFDHSSPAHVAHLRGDAEKKETATDELVNPQREVL